MFLYQDNDYKTHCDITIHGWCHIYMMTVDSFTVVDAIWCHGIWWILIHVMAYCTVTPSQYLNQYDLTHWGQVTHICVGNLTIIGSDNGLSPGRRQAITWTNVGILLIGPLRTNFSGMLIEIHTFSFKKIHLKMSSRKWWPFCLGLNVLTSMRFTGILFRNDVNHYNMCENYTIVMTMTFPQWN